ncbi:MAG: PHB depolymerase family esterase [Myxococcales bacterium]|nr:PHB depolymerase family esterase [Myxococcales bacterium]
MKRALPFFAVVATLVACGSTSTPRVEDDASTPAADGGAIVLPDGAVVVPPPGDAGPLPTTDGGALEAFSYRTYPMPSENPGGLSAFVEAPAGNPAKAVVVVLHGCTQRAADMARAGFSDAAKAYGFVAVYPEQSTTNDATTCFRWYTRDHAARGKGELASIAALANDAKARFGATQVFVAGLSAGGAMAAAALSAYPEVFDAASLQAGIPYGCATSALEGYSCSSTPKTLSAQAWGDLVRAAATPGANVRVQIWQGDVDPVVKPQNADSLVLQWTNVAGIDATPDAETRDGAVSTKAFHDGAGKTRVELDVVAGMGHGTPMATRGTDAPCGSPAAYALDVGACAARGAARFFGLTKL